MGWLIRRLIGWALAGALVAMIGAAAWHTVQITSAGLSMSSVPAMSLLFDVMQLHLYAGIGAAAGLGLGLLGRILRRLRLRLRGLFARDPAPVERPDPDALIRAERAQKADDYLSTLQQRALDNVAVTTQDSSDAPDVENIITAREGRFTYRILAYRHLSHEERMQVVQHALAHGHVQEPEPGGTATVFTALGKSDRD